MRRYAKKTRLLIRLDQWPASHRQLWLAGLDPHNLDDDDDPPHGTSLAEATRRNALKGWGRFLATVDVVALEGASDEAGPAGLVTPAAIRRFIAGMKAAGNSNSTIAARIWEVRTALSIMCPQADFRWLTSPHGTAVRTIFRDLTPRNPPTVHHSANLYRLGLQIMDEADKAGTPLQCALEHRNGLMVAALASRAPRLRTIATPRLGGQLVTGDNGFRLEFKPADLKGQRRALEYDLPRGLSRYIEHYLAVHRPVLLGDKQHTWLWVGQLGEPLREAGIARALRHVSAAYGIAFSAHTFRYAIGTTAPMVDPKRPEIAPALLGNSLAVASTTYNLGRQVEATMKFHETLEEERRQSKALARAAFRQVRRR